MSLQKKSLEKEGKLLYENRIYPKECQKTLKRKRIIPLGKEKIGNEEGKVVQAVRDKKEEL